MIDWNHFLGFLGIAVKGRNAVHGAEACLNGIRNGDVYLVILDGAASENTKRSFEKCCCYHRKMLLLLPKENVLGYSIGKPGRKILGITDRKMAEAIFKKFSCGGEGVNIEH